ncbi:MAG: exo-alpha-sialidase [Acidimicrobiia bacterium]|nr:exo-alpha-sialidase [Acidimicrobiia bacterium]
MNSFIELASGRLLAAFSYMDEKRDTGLFVSHAVYSDDDGATWQASKNDLVVDSGGKGSHSGAIEPVVVQLADGRVWMVIRAQSGYLFESYSSNDGETWSPPKRTHFRSSSAPAAVLRLRDGRLVLVWNNELHSRSSLVMAIQERGEWKGYREISPPFAPEDQNVGARYPFVAERSDRHILAGYGERGRVGRKQRHFAECTTYWNGNTRLFRVDPAWLLEAKAAEDFSQGLQHLQAQATRGVQVLRDSNNAPALRLQKVADGPSGVTWNFPLGKSGKLKIKFRVEAGFKGAYFDLSEYFLQPSDQQGGTFRWMIDADLKIKMKRGGHSGSISRTTRDPYAEETSDIGKIRTTLEAGKAQELAIKWDCETNLAKLAIEGVYGSTLMGMEPARGIGYVRIGLIPNGTDSAGLWVMGLESQSHAKE